MRPPIVVKIGGAALDSPERCGALWAEIARAHEPIVIVHGGGSAVDALMARLGHPVERREGIRVTPPDQVDAIVGVLAGTVNARLVGLLRASSDGPPRAVGLTLADGGTCRARVSRRFGFDPGRVGEVTGGDPRLLEALLAGGFVPVISSIAMDESGCALNVNADEAAGALAGIIGARSLLLLTDVEGVLDATGARLQSLRPGAIDELIRRGTIAGGMIPKLRGALDAAIAGGLPATIASWRTPGIVGAALRGEAMGTRIEPETAATAIR